MTDGCTYVHSSKLGVERIRKGKKAVPEWFQGWKKESPKRKVVLNNICRSAWLLCPTNVCTIDWSIMETTKEGILIPLGLSTSLVLPPGGLAGAFWWPATAA